MASAWFLVYVYIYTYIYMYMAPYHLFRAQKLERASLHAQFDTWHCLWPFPPLHYDPYDPLKGIMVIPIIAMTPLKDFKGKPYDRTSFFLFRVCSGPCRTWCWFATSSGLSLLPRLECFRGQTCFFAI